MEQMVVARVGKPHGLRGEVTVQVHTDDPQRRFVPGAQFTTDPAGAGPLTIASARSNNGILLLGFEEVDDRTGAEGLRGTTLLLDSDDVEPDEDGWYEDELVGLQVVDTTGEVLGEVVALHTRPVQDLLEVRLSDGRSAQVPLVEEIVPEIDVDAGRLVLDAPPGLLDLDS